MMHIDEIGSFMNRTLVPPWVPHVTLTFYLPFTHDSGCYGRGEPRARVYFPDLQFLLDSSEPTLVEHLQLLQRSARQRPTLRGPPTSYHSRRSLLSYASPL